MFKSMQDHTALYRSSPPLPEAIQLDHTKLSAYARPQVNRPRLDPVSSDLLSSSDDDITLVELLGKAGQKTSQEVEVTSVGDSLPSHPKGPRIVRKRKADIASSDDR